MVQERGRGVGVTPPYHHDPGHRHDTSPVHYDTDLIENDGVRYTLATVQVSFTLHLYPKQWRIQDFPEVGANHRGGKNLIGCLPIIVPNFSKQLHENKEIGAKRMWWFQNLSM